MVVKIRMSRTREVKLPTRATPGSAGIDFYIPEDARYLFLKPKERVLIPSGIKADIPEGYALIANNKSGIANKYGLIFGSSVVDSDYQGELHISLINTSDETVRLLPGQKIIQFLLTPIPPTEIIEVPEKDLFNEDTIRGEGGFGSSGV